MSFNTGDIVRITGAEGPAEDALNGTEAEVLSTGTQDFFGMEFPVVSVKLLTINDELREIYESVIPEEHRDAEPIELMNFDPSQLELVSEAAAA